MGDESDVGPHESLEVDFCRICLVRAVSTAVTPILWLGKYRSFIYDRGKYVMAWRSSSPSVTH